MEFVRSILTSAITLGVITPILWFWLYERLRGSIKGEYDRELERIRAKLQLENGIELERLKSQLQIAAQQQSIRLSGVVNRTVDSLATIYEKLVATRDAVADYTSLAEWDDNPREKRLGRVSDAIGALRDCRKLRPFIPKSTADAVDELSERLFRIAVEFRLKVDPADKEVKNPNRTHDWLNLDDAARKEIPKVLSALEDEMRAVLGVSEITRRSLDLSADRKDE